MWKGVGNILLPCTVVLLSPASVLQLEVITVSIRKKPSLSLRSLLEFAVPVDKKFFASKCGMPVAKNKMRIYESSSQQYCNTDTVHSAYERK